MLLVYKLYILWRVEPLLCNDREMGRYTDSFLGNGSVNTFPQQQIWTQQTTNTAVAMQ
jgi:hypothetical protein